MNCNFAALSLLLAGLIAMALGTAELSAHGGRYRGGPTPPPDSPDPGRDTRPAHTPPPPPSPPIFHPVPPPGKPGGPVTPRGTSLFLPDDSRWQLWWEMNKDQFLLVKPKVGSGGPITGGDEYYLGATRREEVPIDLSPDTRQIIEEILPALHRALVDTNNPDLVTACLIGLAKIGRDHTRSRLLKVLEKRLTSTNQEIRETAALALGVTRRADALPMLRDLLLDTAAGRKLVARSEVDDRVRAFAAYGLGIVVAHGDADVRHAGFDALQTALSTASVMGRDVQVAVISAIGVMPLKPDTNSKDKLLLWRALPVLERHYRSSRGKAGSIVQAHVPIAIGRLLGRGDGLDQGRYRAMFAAELASKKRRPNAIVRSAVIALGLLSKPEHVAISDRLYRYFNTGRDQQARYFSLIAIGEIGGDQNRSRLLKVLTRGKKALERPWAAMALGVLSHRARHARNGRVDETIGRALERQLTEVKNRQAAGAFAVAVGMCGYGEAMPGLRRLLDDSRHRDEFAGFLCVGLALASDRASIGSIRAVMHRAVRRPHLLRQSAIALGRLQDRNAAPHLLDMIAGSAKNSARMAAVAGALQFIGDRRTVDALIRRLADDGHTKLARAFIAAALGGIADPMVLPFSARYAMDCNYRAVVATLMNQATGILDLL